MGLFTAQVLRRRLFKDYRVFTFEEKTKQMYSDVTATHERHKAGLDVRRQVWGSLKAFVDWRGNGEK